MRDRDKLIELLLNVPEPPNMISVGHRCGGRLFNAAIVADHLIANGVTVIPECNGCLYANRKRPQKCSCCRRNKDMADLFTPEPYVRHWTEYPPKGEWL